MYIIIIIKGVPFQKDAGINRESSKERSKYILSIKNTYVCMCTNIRTYVHRPDKVLIYKRTYVHIYTYVCTYTYVLTYLNISISSCGYQLSFF